ncbi:MAG: M48 family metallopeptidase [Bacteriovorax sp.]|nr:M48 family metallopeptidase [Bacteriovorax sp.]
MKAKLKGVFWLLSAMLMAVGFSLGFSFFVQQIPWSVERKLALVYDGSYGKNCVGNNLNSQIALDKLVKRIYPLKSDDHKFSLRVQVLRKKSINAFATLGGNIFINEALLLAATTPEELAGILAHEIEHVRLRHILQGVLVRLATAQGLKFVLSGDPGSLSADTASTFFNMSFTKSEEAQADSEGLKRLQMANVSVKGIYTFFKRMKSSSDLAALLSDHPSDSSRLSKLKPFLDKPSKEVLTEVEWISLKEICNH